MKKGFIYLLLLVLGVATFVSCDDDDNDGYKRITAQYTAANLKLTLNGKEISGKTVSIQALNETTANLVLKSLIPGETNLCINALLTNTGGDNYSLEGKSETTDRVITAEGNITEGVLTLNCTFKVTSKVVGNWKLIEQQESTDPNELLGKGPLHFKIVTDIDSIRLPLILSDGSKLSFAIKDNMEKQEAGFVSFTKAIFALMVPNFLYNIELQEDGDLTATYAVTDENMNPVDTVTLAEGIARYNVKDGKIYIAINVDELLPRSVGSDQQPANILTILSEGLPLILDLNGDNMLAYADKTMMVPFMGMMGVVKALVKDMEPMDIGLGIVTAEALQTFLDEVVTLVTTSETIEIGLNLGKNANPQLTSPIQGFDLKSALKSFNK